ncbi:MAG: hypothetical protein JRI34_11810 [Deltaproteobacteria bacterium]|nr:hypothetical protein [Deltaproteobacteria bacterium]
MRVRSFSRLVLALSFALVLMAAGCTTTAKQTSLFESRHESLTKNYTPGEITSIKRNFKVNPSQYSQAFGEMLLWQMHQKCPELGGAFIRIPELNDGINPKEAKAMVSIWNLVKDLDIPPDFFDSTENLEGKTNAITGLPSELHTIREMVLIGRGDRIYSAPLQALLWGYMDEHFSKDDNPLKNYNGPLEFVKPVWGKMDGPRWENFEEVVGRLNTARLIDYYETKKFTYEYYDSGNWWGGTFIPDARPNLIFKKKRGNCVAYSVFTEESLKRSGYEAWMKVFDTPKGEHATVLFKDKDKGKIYVLDNAYFQKKDRWILGPFNSENEALEAFK